MRLNKPRWEQIGIVALLATWVGVWGDWVPARTVSLTQHALYLAEWSTFLPEVRFGNLGLVPELLRLAVGLAVVALAISAGAVKNPFIRWAMRILAVLPGLIILPPYPEVLNLWWSASYGRRFLAAAVVWIGVAASPFIALTPRKVQQGLAIGLSLLAVVLGIYTFMILRIPFGSWYGRSLPPGWGLILFVGGLLLAGGAQIAGLIAQRASHPQMTSLQPGDALSRQKATTGQCSDP